MRSSTYMVDLYRQLQAGDATARTRLIERLGEMRRADGAERVAVLDAQADVVAADDPLDVADSHAAEDAVPRARQRRGADHPASHRQPGRAAPAGGDSVCAQRPAGAAGRGAAG
ncbi:hypothetical protein PEC18_00200 [Paucibacter sp. O1-1]|nr:hypothetical protein [Paucibacter sp. O1-1]MDA3824345.1 hypothetical protein [Paucibacter sp. O1-1]